VPKWGLTTAQRYARPWNLAPHLLRPLKTITDPIHGDVHINVIEGMFLDSPPMQRLRRVRQLGTTHLVYPGANHSRFSHALGTLRVAQDLLDAVVDNRNGPRPQRNLFDEWDATSEHRVEDEAGEVLTFSDFDLELARVTVLARLGALLHDMCHVPFGHTIEDDLGVLDAHDYNLERFERFWAELPDELQAALAATDPQFVPQLKLLILSKKRTEKGPRNHDAKAHQYPFVADIVGNTICADLIDYLERDHAHTGLPVALGHRFTNDFYVSPSDEVHFPARMVIQITRDGHERPDVVTELLKFLRYRYELSERVLVHHAKLAVDAMIGKLLELWQDSLWATTAAERYGHEIPSSTTKDMTALRAWVREKDPHDDVEIDAHIQGLLEDHLTRRGDDGLLEYLRDWGEAAGSDGRRAAVGQLASAVLHRQLFKQIGRSHDVGLAERLHDRFGARDARRALEEGAARCAGVTDRWKVVLWLPSPDMRLKVAQVLVDQDGKINALDKVGNERANDIYRSHQQLWGVSVFAQGDIGEEVEQVLLSYLGESLGVRFRDKTGDEIPSLRVLAARRVGAKMPTGALRQLEARADELAVAAHGAGADPTFEEIVQQVAQIKDEVDGEGDGGGVGGTQGEEPPVAEPVDGA
jgi:HD superfamily phosphohydrolase